MYSEMYSEMDSPKDLLLQAEREAAPRQDLLERLVDAKVPAVLCKTRRDTM